MWKSLCKSTGYVEEVDEQTNRRTPLNFENVSKNMVTKA